MTSPNQQTNPNFNQPPDPDTHPPRRKIISGLAKMAAKSAVSLGVAFAPVPDGQELIQNTTGEGLAHTIGETADEVKETAVIALLGIAQATVKPRFVEKRQDSLQKNVDELTHSVEVHKDAARAVVEGRLPWTHLRPTTRRQRNQAFKASRKRAHHLEKIHEQERLERVWGLPDTSLASKSAVTTALNKGRYSIGERHHHKSASRAYRRIDKKIGPAHHIEDGHELERERLLRAPKIARLVNGDHRRVRSIRGQINYFVQRQDMLDRRSEFAEKIAEHHGKHIEIRRQNRAARKKRRSK